jgi:hypothetical protein
MDSGFLTRRGPSEPMSIQAKRKGAENEHCPKAYISKAIEWQLVQELHLFNAYQSKTIKWIFFIRKY